MSTLDQVLQIDNLERAWRWIRSNPDAAYKSYFRRLYTNYAVADTALLSDLLDRLARGVYEPDHACKLFLPKSSGVLRPYTLLTVEDQIVYQAMVNVVAEKLHPKVRPRYLVEVFSHLYAGKSSPWFYQRWQKGYAHFNRAARQAVADGFRFTARFDLTAFYDSLDHGVLCHFLRKIGCDEAFCSTLTNWLSHWTATRERIYHNHGIPQGPLSSGLLSEVVLRHFDRGHKAPKGVRYLRYVDDIRLFATSLKDLRRMVTKLDLLSKAVGLFPQSNKIHIHEVTDIEAELKSISRPGGDVFELEEGEFDQDQVRRRLIELSPRYEVTDTTEFKFLLGHARPKARLNDRLWNVLEMQPELYGSILRYYQAYSKLPRKVGERLVAELQARPLYAAVIAELIHTAEGRLQPEQMPAVDRFVRSNWKPHLMPADVLAALGCWAFARGLFTYDEVEQAVRNVKEWWARAELVAALDDSRIGQPSLKALLSAKLSDQASDVAIGAAAHLARQGWTPTVPAAAIQPVAGRILEAFRLHPGGATGVCGVESSFTRLLGRKPASMDWRAVFGGDYPAVERHALWCRALADTDVTAWVNAMDVFNDWLLIALYRHDPSLGTYAPGSIGSVMNSTRLKSKYPAVQAMVVDLHTKRGESALSHAWKRKGTRLISPTGPVKYTYLRMARKLIVAAIKELAVKW